MTTLRFLVPVLVVALLGQACGSRQQTTAATDSTQTAPATASAAKPIVLTERLTALGLTQTGDWRGTSLGDPMTAVTTAESGKPFEQDAAHVGYTVEFPNLESADFLYYQQSGKVSSIVVDLYLNTRPAVEAYTKDLTGYFDQRYGQSTVKAGVPVWTGAKQQQISLKDVSKGKDFGLKIRMAPAGSPALTASAH